MRGGGEGVAKEREAELSEARLSWPESHISLQCHSLRRSAWQRTSSPLGNNISPTRSNWGVGCDSHPQDGGSPPWPGIGIIGA